MFAAPVQADPTPLPPTSVAATAALSAVLTWRCPTHELRLLEAFCTLTSFSTCPEHLLEQHLILVDPRRLLQTPLSLLRFLRGAVHVVRARRSLVRDDGLRDCSLRAGGLRILALRLGHLLAAARLPESAS